MHLSLCFVQAHARIPKLSWVTVSVKCYVHAVRVEQTQNTRISIIYLTRLKKKKKNTTSMQHLTEKRKKKALNGAAVIPHVRQIFSELASRCLEFFLTYVYSQQSLLYVTVERISLPRKLRQETKWFSPFGLLEG